ncbi:hypothetical protein STEG23_021839 [Scotinomys teguina]
MRIRGQGRLSQETPACPSREQPIMECRMEETVRSLLQSQGSPEQKTEEPAKITAYQCASVEQKLLAVSGNGNMAVIFAGVLAVETVYFEHPPYHLKTNGPERVSEEEGKHQEALGDLLAAVDEDLRSENSSPDEGRENTRLLLQRLKALEVFLYFDTVQNPTPGNGDTQSGLSLATPVDISNYHNPHKHVHRPTQSDNSSLILFPGPLYALLLHIIPPNLRKVEDTHTL